MRVVINLKSHFKFSWNQTEEQLSIESLSFEYSKVPRLRNHL